MRPARGGVRLPSFADRSVQGDGGVQDRDDGGALCDVSLVPRAVSAVQRVISLVQRDGSVVRCDVSLIRYDGRRHTTDVGELCSENRLLRTDDG